MSNESEAATSKEVASRRFPRRVYGHGAEPDPRFSLANERTFLAWLRTSLALFAAGIAPIALDVPIPLSLRYVAAGIFIAAGFVACLQAWVGWFNTERALRQLRPLPGFGAGAIVMAGLCIAVIVVMVGLLL